MDVFWFFPTSGDGRYLAAKQGARTIGLPYLQQLAAAIDQLGYAGALLPTGRVCEESWVVASALIPQTRRLKFLVAVRPGTILPTVAARTAATFDRLSGGRLLINVVTGGDPVESASDGIHLSHDERYAVTDEFLSIFRGVHGDGDFNFEGQHLRVKNASLLLPPVQRPYPPLFLGGSSPAAFDVTGKHIDLYLTWAEPLEQVKEKVDAVREAAAKYGRTVRVGLRVHVIVRETEKEAWAAADDLIRYVSDDAIAAARKHLAHTESVGQQRMSALSAGGRDHLVVGPNLWAGVGLVRHHCATALVGNPDQVAERIREYEALGIDTFILSGYPHLEESYRVAELLFPLLRPSVPGETSPAAAEPPALFSFGRTPAHA
ncbi:MAG TPA: FMNH2-dependent alkanesulfonate monooxygenase [Tepidisphaeraceae bacterium]|jgi:alkanesulfonate monooxygenase